VLFESMATAERYARFAPKLWQSDSDSGTLDVALTSDMLGAISTVKGWRGHHRLMCEPNRGAAVEIYAAIGCRAVTCERAVCVDRGEADCRFVTRWTAFE
jgi:hypothetical protein